MKYATDSGFPNPTFFIDDGVSGVTFGRPGWNEMIRLAETGKVRTVIVKDMSRMGRDYLKVGYYTESFFAEQDIRYIVHAPDKSSGHRRQKIELVWNFIGEVNLPGDDQTVERQRKGRTA